MFKRFVAYYKPYKALFFYDMLASLFVALIGILYPILTRKVFNDFVINSNVKMIIIYCLMLLVLYVIRMFLRFFVQYQGHVMGVKMQAKMRSDMFSHLQELPYSYYDEHETGKIMSRMTNDLQNVSELAHHGPENFFICGVMVVGSFAYLFYVNWILALIIFACVPILVIISLLLRKKMRDAFNENRKNVATINASLESSISGIRVTKAFTNKDKEIEKFEVGNNDYVVSRSKAYKAMGLFSSSTSFIMDLFNVVCILSGGILAVYGKIKLPDYMAFVVSISSFISPLTTLINFVEQYQDGVTGFKRFLEIMDEKVEVENKNVIDKVHINGSITFNHVCFSYPSSIKKVLDDISFTILKGQIVALVGESGGGKTTICHLIPSFYKATSGNIYLDDININDISFKTLRSAIGIVQQDVFLFNGTIKENILYGKLDATDEEVNQAIKKANLSSFIDSLPDKENTQIGERGVKLSGGQKQRISIARVFLKNPPILILDEATSALDNTTELAIQQSLNELCVGRTTIVVAHRLSTIKNADRILVINDGKIVEDGSHENLMSKDGIYANLYNLQFNKVLIS
ncbi:MAG: ABC transporter ATP-binding protein/permease [Erysipelotrichaceae bacterium]|nr:ABC transporter ATP-binding protein/permease [Erysipelotrichaceae bacterium]